MQQILGKICKHSKIFLVYLHAKKRGEKCGILLGSFLCPSWRAEHMVSLLSFPPCFLYFESEPFLGVAKKQQEALMLSQTFVPLSRAYVPTVLYACMYTVLRLIVQQIITV